MSILRHDYERTIGTDLDPIEDLLNFIITLKSKGFSSDLLRETHGFTNSNEISKTAKLISLHVESASGLAKQAFDGPPEGAFLPLYYSTLNLAKVYLLFLGKRQELENNRWHGAKYDEGEMSKSFLNETIKISNRGTIPLIYKTITGKSIGNNGHKIQLGELYSQITSIGAEFGTVTKKPSNLLAHQAQIIRDDNNGHYLRIEVLSLDHKINPPKPRTLKSFKGLHIATNQGGNLSYETKRIKGRYETVCKNILKSIQRHLLSDSYEGGSFGSWISYAPINGRYHVFSEEICIMLAYFHLSNVVRYNPEHLYKLMDSKYWSIMLGLRKHGYLRYLKLMWGNYIKTSFDID